MLFFDTYSECLRRVGHFNSCFQQALLSGLDCSLLMTKELCHRKIVNDGCFDFIQSNFEDGLLLCIPNMIAKGFPVFIGNLPSQDMMIQNECHTYLLILVVDR